MIYTVKTSHLELLFLHIIKVYVTSLPFTLSDVSLSELHGLVLTADGIYVRITEYCSKV